MRRVIDATDSPLAGVKVDAASGTRMIDHLHCAAIVLAAVLLAAGPTSAGDEQFPNAASEEKPPAGALVLFDLSEHHATDRSSQRATLVASPPAALTHDVVTPPPGRLAEFVERRDGVQLPPPTPLPSLADVELDPPRSSGRAEALSAIADRIDASETLVLVRNRPTILRLKRAPIRDQVGDPELLDALTISPTEYSLTGTAVGSTVLNFWFEADGDKPADIVSLLVRVTEDPDQLGQFAELVARLEAEINRSFPNSAIRLSVIGQQVIVRGQARDIQDAANILRLVATNIPGADPNAEVAQFLALQAQRDAAGDGLPAGAVGAASGVVPAGLLLNGNAIDAIDQAGGIDAALGGLTQTGINGRRINSRLVNLLEVGGIQQVMLKVTVAEVNRTAARSIGADLSVAGGSTGFFSLLPGAAGLGTTANGATLLVDRGNFDLALNALKSLNLARTLSEPNLTTLSGQPARSQVGGSFPVPQITGFTDAGLQGVQFIPFGVQLQFLPTVTDGDRIRLSLQAEVSSTNTGGGATIAGAAVPGLNSSNFSTTVELRHGQTLAVAGLITTDTATSSDRVPGIGSVPVVGRLFSSDTASYGESELVVLVTPYLAAPICGDAPLPVPGSDHFEPSDLDFFLFGRLEGHHGEDYRTPVRAELGEIKSFHRMHQRYILGQPGYSPGLFAPQTVELPR